MVFRGGGRGVSVGGGLVGVDRLFLFFLFESEVLLSFNGSCKGLLSFRLCTWDRIFSFFLGFIEIYA